MVRSPTPSYTRYTKSCGAQWQNRRSLRANGCSLPPIASAAWTRWKGCGGKEMHEACAHANERPC